MIDINNIESTSNTTILGYNFSAPFFIAPVRIDDQLLGMTFQLNSKYRLPSQDTVTRPASSVLPEMQPKVSLLSIT